MFWCGVSGQVAFHTFLQLIWGKTANETTISFGKFVWNWAKNVPSALKLSVKCALCTVFKGNWTQKWLIPDHCTICTKGWTDVRCAIWRKLGVFLGYFCAIWLIKNLGIFYWICEFIKKFRNNSVNCVHNLIVNKL